MASNDVVNLQDATFNQEVLKSDIPVLVDFWAVWCGPCKAIAPAVDELAKQYKGKVKVAKMDVDEHQQVPQQYGIRSIPTLLVFKGGRVVDTIVGAVPKSKLEESLEEGDHLATGRRTAETRWSRAPAPLTGAAGVLNSRTRRIPMFASRPMADEHGDHRRAAVAHERQRHADDRQEPDHHPDVDRDVPEEHPGDAHREEVAEAVASVPGDVERARHEREVEREQEQAAEEPVLLRPHREDEVGVLLGEERQVGLRPLPPALPEPLPRADRDHRLRRVVARAERVAPRGLRNVSTRFFWYGFRCG